MIKNLYWLIILLIFVVFFYYSNKNNNISEGFKNSKVYIGPQPKSFKINKLINLNDVTFGSHSIYELGKIEYPNSEHNKHNIYQNYYSEYF